jgi:alpha-ribazole phosphatase/probable phosphoglycerate mutase
MAGTLCGHTDPPLNEAGRREAGALISLLRDRDIRQICVSDLLRAVQTAEYVADGLGLPYVIDTGLREISFGEWEGRRWSDLKRSLPNLTIHSFESSLDAIAPNGENFARFQERAAGALRYIASRSHNHTTAVITHMGVIRIALRHLARVDEANLRQPIHPCGVYRFVVRGDVFTYTGELIALSGSSQLAQHE